MILTERATNSARSVKAISTFNPRGRGDGLSSRSRLPLAQLHPVSSPFQSGGILEAIYDKGNSIFFETTQVTLDSVRIHPRYIGGGISLLHRPRAFCLDILFDPHFVSELVYGKMDRDYDVCR